MTRSRIRRVPAVFEEEFEKFRRRISDQEGFEPTFGQFLKRALRTGREDDKIFKNSRL